ncbi:MAG TPA: DUF5615 family PIN-like protein [Flavobacteriales bacterium]|nr:DUF5615 family PIN-like protein [Flavobacteriales bacterium]HQW85888.1 DUF5615 family PIN-like protein [Flavobacteriales bacterium]
MKVVVDMCLPPGLAEGLVIAGHAAVHWSFVGDIMASDADIATWARLNEHIIPTHDLDFSDLLFASHERSPSVVIVRENDTGVDRLLEPVLHVLAQFGPELRDGALNAMTVNMARVRRLPLG